VCLLVLIDFYTPTLTSIAPRTIQTRYLMTIVGTSAFLSLHRDEGTAALWPNIGKRVFRPSEQLDHWAIRPLFSQNKQAFVKKLTSLKAQTSPEAQAAAVLKKTKSAVNKMKVGNLRDELSGRGASSAGHKPELVARLVALKLDEGEGDLGVAAADDAEADGADE